MKCFNHPDVDAVGICKQCFKGICASCAADLGYALACKDKHETEVTAVERLISINVKAVDTQAKSVFSSNLIMLLMGIFLLGFGTFGKYGIFGKYSSGAYFMIIFGIIIVAHWIYLSVYNYYLFKKLGINQRDKT